MVRIGPVPTLLAMLAGVILGACSKTAPHGVTIKVADTPVDTLSQVVVTFTSVTFHNSDGTDVVVPVSASSIDLTKFTGGASAILLDSYPLPAGTYEWLRLSIDPAQTYVVEQVGGAQLPLACPSCAQSGLKFNHPFTVAQTGLVQFTLDFDLRQSITYTKPNGYKLRPTVRVLDANTVLSQIAGAVTDGTTAQQFQLSGFAGCVAYAFQGAVVTPDDIYLDSNGVNLHPNASVVNTGAVAYDSGTNTYRYLVANLPAGVNYTVALTCDSDDPAAEDNTTFYGAGTVSPLGATPFTYDITMSSTNLSVDPTP